MGIRLLFVLTVHCLFADLSQGFFVAGIPDTVTESQPVVLTWVRAFNDPSLIMLGYTGSGVSTRFFSSIIGTGITDQILEGTMTVIFSDVRIVLIQGFDMTAAIPPQLSRSPFFEDKHQITVFNGGAPAPPATTRSTTPGGQPSPTFDTRSQDDPTASTAPDTLATPTSFTTASSGSNGETGPLSPSTADAASGSPKSKVNRGLVTGMATRFFTLLLSVGLAWYFIRRKKRSAIQAEPLDNLYPSPFPFPGKLGGGEASLSSRRKNNPVFQATASNDIPEHEQRKEPINTHGNAIVAISPIAADGNPTVEERSRLEVPSVGIFHHTDSGWRLAFGRRSQPSEPEVEVRWKCHLVTQKQAEGSEYSRE
ncbi:hypothetical protein PM082_014996 [Marasmius tenuissimus]|nr:hypothetical protein PM082_014996 [Marasmius tenuissimus]